jgi:hypothetical protein
VTETDSFAVIREEQDLWRGRLVDAETRYHVADDDLQRLSASGCRTEGARAHKIQAREEYLRVLRIFTDLVLRGKSPAADN